MVWTPLPDPREKSFCGRLHQKERKNPRKLLFVGMDTKVLGSSGWPLLRAAMKDFMMNSCNDQVKHQQNPSQRCLVLPGENGAWSACATDCADGN